MSATTMETPKVEVKVGRGCLVEIIGLIFWLVILPGAFYLLHNWQVKIETEARLEANKTVTNNLQQVVKLSADLITVDIVPAKEATMAYFVFNQQGDNGNQISSTTTTLEFQTQAIGGGVFKIFTPPTEYIIGLPIAKWYVQKFIIPQLPEYSFLLVTPYSLEFCTTTGNCAPVKKTADYLNDKKGEFSYYF